MKIKRIVLFVLFFSIGMLFFSINNNVYAMDGAEMGNKLTNIENNVSRLKSGVKYYDYSPNGTWKASTCMGFANDVADELFGSSHYTSPNDWQWYNSVDDICIGDVIEYWEPASSSSTHTFIVTNLDGNNIEVTDSNWRGDNVNIWHKGWTNTTDLANSHVGSNYGIRNGWHHKGSYVKKLITDNEAPKFQTETGEIVLSSITSTSVKVRVKATDNIGISYIDMGVKTPTEDFIWGNHMTYNNNTGYYEGIVSSDGRTTKTGLYTVHCYAFDAAGNSSGYAFNAIPMGMTINKNLGNFTAKIQYKNNSNYVIGTNGSNSNGTAVILKSKSKDDLTQVWQFTKQSDNTYEIINVATGKALNVNNSSDVDGTSITLYNDNNSSNQRFYIMNFDGGYRLVPKSSLQCKGLNLLNGSVANGTKIQLFKTNGYTNTTQSWKFEKVAAVNGLNMVNETWYYFKDNKIQTNYTGLVQYNNGWFYVKKGQIDWSYTGLVQYNNGWFYVKKGKLDWNYTGLVQYNNGWFYVKKGKLDWSYTGLVQYNNGWFYVKKGKLDWNYTGLVQYNNGWFYVKKGKLDWNYTGLVQYNNGWFYVKKGKLDWNYTGLVPYNNSLFYVKKGKIDWSFNGNVAYNGKTYIVKKGKALK